MVQASVDNEFLRQFYRTLSLGPLEPDDPRYVELYDPGNDPVEHLTTTVEWAVDPSTQLLMGYRGTGKTTQILRLRRRLEQSGYRVYHVDVEAYLNTALPVDVIDYLLFVAGALSDQLEEDGSLEATGFWQRVKDRFGEWGIEGASLGLPGDLGSVDLKRNLKEDPSFLQQLRSSAAGHLGRLVQEVREFLSELRDGGNGDLVLLVDSTDHYQGSALNAEHVQASVQALFTDHQDKVKLPVHSVYTVPPYLKARAKNITNYYGTGALSVIPEVPLRHPGVDDPDPAGIATLKKVVDARGDWRRLVDDANLERLILLSGGHVRDLLRMLAELTRRSRNRPIPADDELIDQVIAQMTNEALPIADEDARWLARIAEDHTSGLERNEDIPALARFLNQGLVLCYYNGGEWYDVHPLIRDQVLHQAEQLASRYQAAEDGRQASTENAP